MSNDPWRSCPPAPAVGDDTKAVLEEAVHTLTMLRSPMLEGDALAAIHATVSLIAQAQATLPNLIADARDQDHTWADIALQFGVTPTAAIARHLGRARHRTNPTDID